MSPLPTESAGTSTDVPLVRDTIKPLLKEWPTHPHAGLLIDKSSLEWTDKTDRKSGFIKKLAGLTFDTSHPYQAAYSRWKNATVATSTASRFCHCVAQIQGRLYVGTERNNAIEAGITTHRVWGAPMIPGSAVKGVCRAHALDIGLKKDIVHWLFGNEHGEADAEKQAVGQVIFHDAWWVPGSGPASRTSQPFVQEIVTPHHPKYYSSEGATPATDFDSPIPAPQIATHGKFLFVLEAVNPQETKGFMLAKQLLTETLSGHGIGAKGSSGYGYLSIA
jgi:CRISPR-associated protein Cmr6